ncbi:MAG: DUF3108 domain-containing protein [Deltaproteobacteria bacterium]
MHYYNKDIGKINIAIQLYVRKAQKITSNLLMGIILSGAALLAAEPQLAAALAIPEKLVYDLTWMGVTAGTATQEIQNDNGTVKIISTAHSASWLSAFFLVDDRIESVMAISPAAPGLPKSYRMKIKEGKTVRDKEIQFDHSKRTALYIDHLNGERKNFDITEKTLDTLSSFYFVRSQQLEVGKSVFMSVFDSKKLWNTEVQVLRKEKIKTVLGSFDTIVVKPLMQSEGIFEKKGDMYIWLTDDKRLLPVKMKTKVPVGSITATLVGGEFLPAP